MKHKYESRLLAAGGSVTVTEYGERTYFREYRGAFIHGHKAGPQKYWFGDIRVGDVQIDVPSHHTRFDEFEACAKRIVRKYVTP